ncbi:PREDICTED: uncharacterized protein LOC108358261 [Rhagoletis zephyria]|uniref:uncharacterized protein LOC108358261 n=1 Tax=Rhagoletis zephyria TaxID=28612 RepID=UPI000811714D|nr:PREDICTED: uncharacterized protein LOC108358261 [Rhagoletis zephyria]
MAMVDADYKSLFVEVRACGRESDGGVFARCPLSAALADNSINFPASRPLPHEGDPMPFVIVPDDAFPLKPYILKLFSYREQLMSHKIFNYRLSRARNVVENVFAQTSTMIEMAFLYAVTGEMSLEKMEYSHPSGQAALWVGQQTLQ